MAHQQVIWTALPAGFVGPGQLLVSAFVSPRLTGATTLDAFPDFSRQGGNWASNDISLQVAFDNGPQLTATVYNDASRPPRRPDLWNALFPGATTVEPHTFDDYSGYAIASYPLKDVVEFVDALYQQAASQSATEFPGATDLLAELAPLNFFGKEAPGISTEVPASATKAAQVQTMYQALLERKTLGPGPAGTPQAVTDAFLQLEQFHDRYGSVIGQNPHLHFTPQPDPSDPNKQARDAHGNALGTFQLPRPSIDFHRALSAIGEHPMVLRLLGLVIDLVVDIPSADQSPPANGAVRLVPSWTPLLADTVNLTPRTAYQLDGGANSFLAAPRANDPVLDGGRLRFDDASRYKVVTQDHDGAALKVFHLASHIGRTQSSWRAGGRKSLDTPTTYALPARRSAGFSVAQVAGAGDGRDVELHLALNRSAELNTALADPAGAPTLSAEDVTRGYRVDVLDSLTGRWHSIMRRRGAFRFLRAGDKGVVPVDDEESWVSTTPTSEPTGQAKVFFVPQTLFRWSGWSLAAPRPERSIQTDSTVSAGRLGNPSATDFMFETAPAPDAPSTATGLAVVPGSLPRLRFGARYALRARAADLAGNSVPFGDPEAASAADLAAFHATPLVTYGRYEPVQTPIVVLRHPLTAGESMERMVLRSDVDATGALVLPTSAAERHLLPPKTSQLLAEQHGVFDVDADPPLDTNAYNAIAQRDGASLEIDHDQQKNPDGYSAEAGKPQDVDYLPVPWLSDPLSRGPAFKNLDGDPDRVFTEAGFSDPGAAWPDYRSVRLRVVTGGRPPTFSEAPPRFDVALDGSGQPTHRVVTVELSPGQERTVRLSTRLDRTDLRPDGKPVGQSPLAVWNEIDTPGAPAPTPAFNDAQAGQHWLLTPWRRLTLVHAVRQPLLTPEWGPAPDAGKSALGQTFVDLTDRSMTFSRRSTGRVDINATWPEPVDTGTGAPTWSANPAPTAGAHAFEAPLVAGEGPATDPPTDYLLVDGRHEFGDTKHRWVQYSATATTRFAEYYVETHQVALQAASQAGSPAPIDPRGVAADTVVVKSLDGTTVYQPGTDYTVQEGGGGDAGTITALKDGALKAGGTVNVSFVALPTRTTTVKPVTLNVLSSARPAAPKVLYVLPLFSWQRSASRGGPITSTRKGDALRVYLDRPWWSSGADEQLGVVLWPGAEQAAPGIPPAAMTPYLTQWGADPIAAPSYPGVRHPRLSSFPGAAATATGLFLDELPHRDAQPDALVNVAGHKVDFDPHRNLWYCDIELDAGGAYLPFVRLALARFQPHSMTNPPDGTAIDDVHLSRVVLADFVQLAPDRSVTVADDGRQQVKVTVNGKAYLNNSAGKGPGFVHVVIEARDPSVADPDLGWGQEGPPVSLAVKRPKGADPYWTGTVSLRHPRAAGAYRLVVQQFDEYLSQDSTSKTSATTKVGRLLFSDVVPI